MKDILSKLRSYEIRIRRAVDGQMHGSFKSVFKGSGLEFTDLRTYQYGDDIRLIDWNASSKGHGIFTKIFREEKEQTVFFVIDVSASQQIGQEGRSKLDTTREICGVLALSAMQEASQVGLYCFSDRKERYLRPKNSLKHGYQVILELFRLKPVSLQTNLADALRFTLNILRKKSVVFVISDFIDTHFEPQLKALARKHDLIVLHLYDDREVNLPSLGIIPVFDQESRQTQWLNTSSGDFRKAMRGVFYENQSRLEQLCKEFKANYLAINTEEDYVPKLVKLFRVRQT